MASPRLANPPRTQPIPAPNPPTQLSPGVTPWKHWNTPQTLWGSVYLIWALDALLLLTAVIGAQVHREAVKGVGVDSAPSIIHAQHIKTALADMDANIANELLGDDGKMTADAKSYENRRIEASRALIDAAQNITYPGEREPIESIQVNMGTYEARVQQARDLHQRGEAAFVNAYRETARVTDEMLLPQADALDKVNRDQLDKIYNSLSNKSMGSVILLLAAGAFLLWALVSIQKLLTRKTHRIFNPMLLLATVIAIGFMLYTFSTLGSVRHFLKVAKQDAFESIHTLLRAEAIAYAANADESRYLLDATRAPAHEKAFFTKAAALATIPNGKTYHDVAQAVANGEKVDGFSGYLADEANNITFDGEREAAARIIESFGAYLASDTEVRRLQQSGKHAEALELCIGVDRGETRAFAQFDDAIKTTVDLNQKQFDRNVNQAAQTLSYFELKAGIVGAAIAMLAFFGLLKRIQEYR